MGIVVISTCKNCGEPFTKRTFKNRNENLCSKRCVAIYRRRKKSTRVFKLTNQIVIKINENSDQKYFILVELTDGMKEAFLVERANCELIIFKDQSGKSIKRLLLKNKENKTRVRRAVGYEKIFWITETGILISRRKHNVLSQAVNKKGYLVHASRIGGRNGKTICPRIHRMVAQAFIPNPDNKPEVNHIDGNKQNPKMGNLEWVTPMENTQHAVATGLIAVGTKSSNSMFSEEEIKSIRSLRKSGISYRKISKMFREGLNKKTIMRICLRRTYRDIN